MNSQNPQGGQIHQHRPIANITGERAEAFRAKITRYRRVLAAYWWIPALSVGVGLAWQGWVSITSPITYQSVAKMFVSGRIMVPEGGMFNEEAVNFFGTQLELMSSSEVQRRASARVQAMRPDLAVGHVQLGVSQLPQTSIFLLRASGQNPDYVKSYLNAVIEEYISLRRGIFSEKSQNTLSAITEELGRVEEDLRRDEDILLEWRKANNLNFLQEEGESTGSYLASLNRDLARQESELQLLDQLTEEQNIGRVAESASETPRTDDSKPGGITEARAIDILVTEGGGPSQSYLALKRRRAVLEAFRSELLETRQEGHPRVAMVDEELRQNDKLLEVYRQQAVDQLTAKRQTLTVQIANLKSQIAIWEKKSLELSARVGEFDKLRSKVDRQKNLYDRLLASVQSVDVNSNIQQDMLSVLEYASPPGVSIQPIARDLALGAALGALVGVAILLVIGALDDRIVSLSDLQTILGEEVVAIIPKVPHGQEHLRAVESDNRGLFEAFRKIRSWIEFTDWVDGPPKSILISSAAPEEGKTTVAANLAVVFAASGARTLLIDCDLRRGRLHQAFGIEQDPGLGDVLNAALTVERGIHQTEIANLWIMPRGYYGEGGSDLFVKTSVDHILGEVEKRFDIVIIDTSPVLAVEETTIVAGRADVALFVIRSGVTSLRTARRGVSHLSARQADVAGIVYNAVDPSDYEFPYYSYFYTARDTGSEKKAAV